MNSLITMTDETMVHLISAASFRVVYTAPAMSMSVAQAIVQFVQKTSVQQAVITLNCCPDVYREGYGEIEALDLLHSAGISVHDANVKVGIFIADEVCFVYTPAPRSASTSKTVVQNNAVHISLDGYDELQPLQMNSAYIGEKNKLDALTIYSLKEELTRQPVPDFDFQHKLSQYRRLIQFVEVVFHGGRLEKTTIKIPSQLLNIAREKGFEEKIKASYQLFDKEFSMYTKPMADKVETIRAKYLRIIPKFGNVILVKEKKLFMREFQEIQQEIEAYTVKLQREVEKQIQNTKQELVNNFTPILQLSPPKELVHSSIAPLQDADIREYINLLLSEEIPSSEEVLKRIELHSTFKDITEETLRDEQFYRQLEKAFKHQRMHWPHEHEQQEELTFK